MLRWLYNSCIGLPDSCVHNNNIIVTCIVNWDATPRVQIARGLRDGTPFHYLGSYLPRSRQEDESLRRGNWKTDGFILCQIYPIRRSAIRNQTVADHSSKGMMRYMPKPTYVAQIKANCIYISLYIDLCKCICALCIVLSLL